MLRRLWTCAFITAPLLLPSDEFHLLHVLSTTFHLFLLLFAVIWRLQLWWIPSRHNSSVYKRTLWRRGTLWMCCICPLTLTQFPACEPLLAILDITFLGNFTTPEWMVYCRKENFLTLQCVDGNQSNRSKVETRVMSPEIYSHVTHVVRSWIKQYVWYGYILFFRPCWDETIAINQ